MSKRERERHWTHLRDESITGLFKSKITPKTTNQQRYIKALESSTVTICTGPAGTGKTYLACAIAANLFREHKIEQIILTRPIVGCDEKMGDLPGSLLEKVSEDMQPMLDAMREFFSKQEVEKMLLEEKLLVVPFSKMRGRTFKRSFVVLDEAQNTTFRQIKMFLTRLGEKSRMAICGDHTQSDLPNRGENALLEVIQRFRDRCHASISIVALGREDIVRHELIRWMDERLSDSVTYAPQQELPKEASEEDECLVKCPECHSTLACDPVVQEHPDPLVECWNCQVCIQLLDEEGEYDPLAVDEVPQFISRVPKDV
jgi:phosphate starvation-inducible PhoH-like protein